MDYEYGPMFAAVAVTLLAISLVIWFSERVARWRRERDRQRDMVGRYYRRLCEADLDYRAKEMRG